jgi:hypothetical protein
MIQRQEREREVRTTRSQREREREYLIRIVRKVDLKAGRQVGVGVDGFAEWDPDLSKDTNSGEYFNISYGHNLNGMVRPRTMRRRGDQTRVAIGV